MALGQGIPGDAAGEEQALAEQPKNNARMSELSKSNAAEAKGYLRRLVGEPVCLTTAEAGINQCFVAETPKGSKLFVKFLDGHYHRLHPDIYSFVEQRITAPELLLQKRLRSGLLLQVFRHVDGLNLAHIWPTLTQDRRQRYIKKAAYILDTLHRLTLTSLPKQPPIIDITAAVRGMAHQLPPDTRKLIVGATERSEAIDLNRHLCHGDYSIKNMIIEKDDLIIVDWEWAAASDRSFDMKNIRLALEKNEPWAAELFRAYNHITTEPLRESRLLLSDLYYSLIMIRLAKRRKLDNLQIKHEQRCRRIALLLGKNLR